MGAWEAQGRRAATFPVRLGSGDNRRHVFAPGAKGEADFIGVEGPVVHAGDTSAVAGDVVEDGFDNMREHTTVRHHGCGGSA